MLSSPLWRRLWSKARAASFTPCMGRVGPVLYWPHISCGSMDGPSIKRSNLSTPRRKALTFGATIWPKCRNFSLGSPKQRNYLTPGRRARVRRTSYWPIPSPTPRKQVSLIATSPNGRISVKLLGMRNSLKSSHLEALITWLLP